VLQSFNRIDDPRGLSVGQTIQIPLVSFRSPKSAGEVALPSVALLDAESKVIYSRASPGVDFVSQVVAHLKKDATGETQPTTPDDEQGAPSSVSPQPSSRSESMIIVDSGGGYSPPRKR